MVGKGAFEWYIHVISGYMHHLILLAPTSSLKQTNIYLSGHAYVEYVDGNIVQKVLACIVPVY